YVRSATTQSANLMDSLSVRVTVAIAPHVMGAGRSPTTLPAKSKIALWWYLQGEWYLRRSNRTLAKAAYDSAIKYDSTSPLVLRRLRTILRSGKGEWDSTSMAYAVLAGSRNHGLGPRDSMLVLADSLYGAIVLEPYSPMRLARIRRWLSALDWAVGAFPLDREPAYEGGEAMFHFGELIGIPEDSALSAFEAAIRLDQGYASAYFHAVELAIRYRTVDSTVSLIRQYLRINPRDSTFQFALHVL